MSRTSRIAIGVLIVALIAAGAAILINNHKNATTSTTTTTAANVQRVTTVTYNGSGFTPSDITVTSGTTITFVNNSSTSVQVVSANAGFNAGKAVTKGQSYSFTFNSKGSFTYDNDLNKTQTGKVTVL